MDFKYVIENKPELICLSLRYTVHFSILFYSAESVSDDLLKQAGDKCIKLMQFRGWNSYSVRIWQILIGRFPTNFEYQRQLGVTYLTIGNDESAKKVFEELVHLNQDSFAKAHLGKLRMTYLLTRLNLA